MIIVDYRKGYEVTMYKACIFDLDGTLTNTLDSLVYSTNEDIKRDEAFADFRRTVSNICWEWSKSADRKALGSSGTENLDRIEEAMQIYGRIFDANCTYHVVPYEGITEMLESMKNRGLNLQFFVK